MIIPSSVTDSITAAGIDVSNDWLSATAPVWNADYSAVLTQPISIAVTPLADMRFLGVTAATITIRISSAPLSLVSWSGIATLVADDTTGGGSPIYPVHNSFTGRDVADTHPLASITGLVDALDGKAAALHASTHYAGGSDPIAGQSLAGLQATDSPAFNQLVLTKSGGGVSGANICALVLDSNEPGFVFKKDAGPSQNKYWNIGVSAGDWGPSFYHINDEKTLKTPVWKTRFNTTTGRIEFALGLSGYTDTIVSGTFKIGSLAGTLIGTAGVVSALSGTGLVLGNGTTTASLDAGIITTGTFADARIASAATWNAKLSSSAASGVTGNIAIFSGVNSVSDNTGLSFDGTDLWCDGYIHGGGFKVSGSNFVDASRNIINGGSGTFSGALWGYGLRSTGNVTIDTNYALVMDSITRIGSTGIGNFSKLQIASLDVVGARKAGWAAATGTATRTTFATSTVTLPQLAERVKALLDDLIAHGLIGA